MLGVDGDVPGDVGMLMRDIFLAVTWNIRDLC